MSQSSGKVCRKEAKRFTCKHGDFINIVKLSIPLTIEASPKIRNQDLSPLVDSHSPPVEGCLVPEAGETLC